MFFCLLTVANLDAKIAAKFFQKNYAAVLVDLDKRKPIALLEKRNKEAIAEYLQGLGSEILSQIEEVSIDLWKPYKTVVE
ncbi:Transposase subfamily [Coleofasciculus chthonoplastes PCC 7420]|uniref:Transposase subfamily n=1 Tax=Coleofasciculus chthonoplastes PCC 7420 TaxID=118168 RepID=B4VQ67_9CYAN|nr:Transposase subfamily [Coleofasciculus chthonoplastes PCC 7420]